MAAPSDQRQQRLLEKAEKKQAKGKGAKADRLRLRAQYGTATKKGLAKAKVYEQLTADPYEEMKKQQPLIQEQAERAMATQARAQAPAAASATRQALGTGQAGLGQEMARQMGASDEAAQAYQRASEATLSSIMASKAAAEGGLAALAGQAPPTVAEGVQAGTSQAAGQIPMTAADVVGSLAEQEALSEDYLQTKYGGYP
jgi:hypothetical protein